MKTIETWQDLRPYGVVFLTGEACALMMRLLCDVTERGRKVLARMYGIPDLKVAAAWNHGAPADPHVGSILLTHDMLTPLAVFCLLENGCDEVYATRGRVVGFEPADGAELRERYLRNHREGLVRRYAYGAPGSVLDRNVHQCSGRVQ